MLASDILTIPFQWCSTFVIEEKYGFNKTTLKTFITDKLKGYLPAAFVGGSLLSALIYLIQTIGPNFRIWFSVLAAIFVLFINMFYTMLILPMFSKLTAPISSFAQSTSKYISPVSNQTLAPFFR